MEQVNQQINDGIRQVNEHFNQQIREAETQMHDGIRQANEQIQEVERQVNSGLRQVQDFFNPDRLLNRCKQINVVGDLSTQLSFPENDASSSEVHNESSAKSMQSIPSGLELASQTTAPSEMAGATEKPRRRRVSADLKLLSQPTWARDDSVTQKKNYAAAESSSHEDEDLESPEGLFASGIRLFNEHLYLQAENRFCQALALSAQRLRTTDDLVLLAEYKIWAEEQLNSSQLEELTPILQIYDDGMGMVFNESGGQLQSSPPQTTTPDPEIDPLVLEAKRTYFFNIPTDN